MSDKIYLGARAGELVIGIDPLPVSRVNLAVDSEHIYTAGDDTGRALELSCPWGSQAMADEILATAKAHKYTPYTAKEAILDPAAELGDAVTVGGIYSTIINRDIDYNAACAPTISAPGVDEIEEEYPYETQAKRNERRQLAKTRSLIKKTSTEILLQVENQVSGLNSSIQVELGKITQRVDDAEGSIEVAVSTLDGLTVRDSGGVVKIKGGMVTADGLHVNAANIDGTLTANQIDATNLKVSAANITGSLTIGQLPGDVAIDSDIPTRTSQLTNDSGYQTETGVVSIVNGTVTADYVNALGISASVIQGEVVDLLDDRGRVIGSFTIENSGLEGLKTVTLSSEELYFKLTDPNGGIYLYTKDGTGIRIAGNEIIDIEADLRPRSNDRYWLGSSSRAWQDIYSVNDPTVTSDRRLKNSITYNMHPYDAFFDNLRPTPYKLNNGTSGRTHLGLIAQDVEQALKNSNLSTKDFAGFVFSESDTVEESGNRYALRYGEFISLLIYEVQQLKKRVAELEAA